MEQWSRQEMLLSEDGTARLAAARVAVFGLGGVGSFAAEALCRSGIGSLLLVDDDIVAESNLNRQLIALHSTLGMPKAEVMRARALDINPRAEVIVCVRRYDAQSADAFDLESLDYIVDAIDSVTSKLLLAVNAREAGTPLISSMGTGNKLDPTRFEVADIYSTSVCPLARVMRRELKARGIPSLKVVYSKEEPRRPAEQGIAAGRTPGSVAFVPPVAGMILAGEVVKDLLKRTCACV